jgi:hypothetical protein
MARTKNSGTATRAVAAQVKPVANNTSAAASRGLRKARDWAGPQVERTGQVIQDAVAPAASRGVRKARAWTAPRVERTGQVIQDTVAPKVADALAASARRIDPGKPGRRRWPMVAGIAALLAAAAAAAAAALRNRTATSATTRPDEEEPTPLAEQAKADAARTS